jgi:hypothetical protein
MDGLPPQSDNVSITYLPNISYANADHLNGFVFAVDRPKNFNLYTTSGTKKTKVIADIFPKDKIFSGMTCIRLPNNLRIESKKGQNPYEVIEDMGYVQLERKLRETIKDYEDLSMEGSYAGFYVSQDLSRHGERQLWIVVSTGQIDISRTVHAYISGIYNPYVHSGSTYETNIPFSEDLEKYQKHLNELKEKVSEVLKNPSGNGHGSEDSSYDSRSSEDYGSDSSYSDSYSSDDEEEKRRRRRRRIRRRKRKEKEKRSKEDGKGEEEFDIGGGSVSSESSRERDSIAERELAREIARKMRRKRLLKQASSSIGGRKGEEVNLKSKVSSKLMEDQQLQAWKYVKLLRGCFAEIRLLEKTLHDTYYSKQDNEHLHPAEEPAYIRQRPMHWETTIMKEKFISDMCIQSELKRWLVIDKLAQLVGVDLFAQLGIDPTDSSTLTKNENVISVTTNTFSTYNRSSKMVFYSGSFCKTTLMGAVPVPISPLDGISILKGPTPKNDKTIKGKEPIDPSSENDNPYFTCVATMKDIDTKESIPIFSTVKGKYASSPFIQTISGIKSFKIDMDLGDTWSVESSQNSIYLRGAFPFGTGRKKKYLNPKPEFLPALSGIEEFQETESDEGDSKCYQKTLINTINTKTAVIVRSEVTSEDEERSKSSSQKSRKGGRKERRRKRPHRNKSVPPDMIPNDAWGPRGIIDTGNNKMLFTWGNTKYHSHPRLAKGVFNPRNEAFQVREWQLGYQRNGDSIGGMIQLMPYGVVLASPGFVQNRKFSESSENNPENNCTGSK